MPISQLDGICHHCWVAPFAGQDSLLENRFTAWVIRDTEKKPAAWADIFLNEAFS
jgi:hypothetical protein